MKKDLAERVLSEQKEEFDAQMNTEYCHRPEEKLVNMESSLAQVVIGVRRSGKSTMCFNVLQQYRKSTAYVNFDDERFMTASEEDFDIILECLYKLYGDFSCLFLDEVQNVEGWHLFVNRLLRQKLHILITGSNAKLLSGELATYLTGRYMQIELYPFSFSEFCDYHNYSKRHDTARRAGLLQAAFSEYMENGGFPELQEEPRKQAYIDTLVRNILTNDVGGRYAIKYKAAFTQLANSIMDRAPVKISYKGLQKQFGIKSDHTVENYVSYLKNAYILIGLHKYSKKSKIRVRSEKAYTVDIALMNRRENALSGANLGWRLETIVYIELLRRYRPEGCDIYYLDETGGEIDFLVCQGNNVKLAVQVSYDISEPKTYRRELNGLVLAARETGCEELLLVTDHDRDEIEYQGCRVKIVSAYAWLVDE